MIDCNEQQKAVLLVQLETYLPQKKNLFVRDVGYFLDLSPSTVKFMLRTGELEGFQARKGGRWLIPREALERFIEEKINKL